MTGRKHILVAMAPIVLPLLAGSLWLASGRELLTKPLKAVDVRVKDELFGDTLVQKRFVPGPVLGYYIGMDLVALSTAAALAAWGTGWWFGRRRKASG